MERQSNTFLENAINHLQKSPGILEIMRENKRSLRVPVLKGYCSERLSSIVRSII